MDKAPLIRLDKSDLSVAKLTEHADVIKHEAASGSANRRGSEGRHVSTTEQNEPDRSHRSITFTVDGEPVTTTTAELTPNQILELAGIDPTMHYLERIEGRKHISYEGKGDEPIHVHKHEVFVSIPTGPTPTS